MDFDLSEEQRLLKDSVDRLMADRYDFESRRRHGAGPEGFSRDLWRAYAELGLLALPFAEEHGGFGGGPVEIMLVMEAFGRALALEPYLTTVLLGGGLLRRASRRASASSPSRRPSGSRATTSTTSARPPGATGRASC